MGKKKFKVFNDHPCIMHIEDQDHFDCLDSIPELVKNNDGSLSVKTPWQDFERVCYEVINAVHKSGKFRAIDYNWFYEIHDAIHHDDRLIAKLETMAKVSELEKRMKILDEYSASPDADYNKCKAENDSIRAELELVKQRL